MDQIMLLTRRVYRLEQEVARLKGAPLEEFEQIAPGPLPPPPTPGARAKTAPGGAAAPVAVAPRAPEGAFESELVGTWFARIGAVALIIGAGFAFKYGIDRGLIGPGARVVIGIAAGLGLIGWGEWARTRAWPRFAQAVTAAGLGTMVLSIWAAYHLYGFLSAGPAFAFLVAVTGLAVALAVRHDSEALAALAAFGAFINPLLVGGRSQPAALYGYVLVIDAGIVGLAALKRWPSLNLLGLVASWILFGLGAGQATTGVALGYASAIFAVFTVSSLITSEETGAVTMEWRALLVAANGVAYLAAGLVLLGADAPEARGAFAAFVAAAHVVLGAAIPRMKPDRAAEATASVLAMAFFTTAVGFQWRGLDVTMAWAVEAAVIAAAGTVLGNRFLRASSLAVLGLSVGTSLFRSFEFGRTYLPDDLLASRESMVFGVQIVAALTLSLLLAQGREVWERQAAAAALAGANVLAVLWFSFEAYAHYRGAAFEVPLDRRQALQFTLSAIWGIYAAALLAIGIAVRSRMVRLMSIALFALTIFKMAVADLWTLTTGFRMLGFLGLGSVLLMTSLSYHRFRDVILGPPERTD